ncbi:AbrB family transcriptional regulator [Staphylococcus saccharolyticus]|nr:AbrB family transcriptional regulator [Staphylococcus saccharolyticus]MBL7583679.1 AbrB family transcriptional regulator [Staphylococcus saccharolyticus]MBL7639004.1 AbrB family transcriptional regulator [Staphylococcus saccharolyticus]QRJ69143.1 AbrB family transcriptional regulator [Staphylococcus saccharolyticus]
MFLSFILKVSHILLPFMFGPIIAAILCLRVFKLTIKWPFCLSQMGLIFLGIEIGSSFTKSVIGDISNNWLIIIIVTVLLIVISLLIAFFFKKIAKVNVNIETAILSVIPGALSQMLIIAEENKNSNILVVSLTQTSRIIFVVILVPLISYFFQDSSSSKEVGINSTILYHVP